MISCKNRTEFSEAPMTSPLYDYHLRNIRTGETKQVIALSPREALDYSPWPQQHTTAQALTRRFDLERDHCSTCEYSRTCHQDPRKPNYCPAQKLRETTTCD